MIFCCHIGIINGANVFPGNYNVHVVSVIHFQAKIGQHTICGVLRRHVGDILSKDDSKATRMVRQD